jgi:hypothetical protein
MISINPSIPLERILADHDRVPLIIGRESATELGLVVLEYLETTPDVDAARSLVAYAARHDENSPARDALVSVLLNASDTLTSQLAQFARAEIMRTNWGPGRESAGLMRDPEVSAVPRRQAFAERMLAERARRIRPRMHVVVANILEKGGNAEPIPTWFLARNWIDLRDALTQRVRSEPVHRDQITRWLESRPAPIRARFKPIEDALIDVATQAILHHPESAPLAPYLGDTIVEERVRSATTFRGAPARLRLSKYLARLSPGTSWYEKIRSMVAPEESRRAG